MITLPNLTDLLKYKNTWILDRYKKDYPNNQLSAEEALTELLKYFWISNKHKLERTNNPNEEFLKFDCYVHPEMKQIDDMWHTFLLFTREYAEFCHQYFSVFLHHQPRVDNEKPNLDSFELEFTRYLSYIYDHLGAETVYKWFEPHVENVTQ